MEIVQRWLIESPHGCFFVKAQSTVPLLKIMVAQGSPTEGHSCASPHLHSDKIGLNRVLPGLLEQKEREVPALDYRRPLWVVGLTLNSCSGLQEATLGGGSYVELLFWTIGGNLWGGSYVELTFGHYHVAPSACQFLL